MDYKEYGNDNTGVDKKNKKKSNILKLVAIFAVAIIVVLFAVINSLVSGCEKPVKNYYKALNGV